MFPELGMALPVTRIVVNIPLIDFTLENGCTEVWPGSHLIVDPVTTPETEDEALFKDYHVCSEERGATLPSVRMVMPAGRFGGGSGHAVLASSYAQLHRPGASYDCHGLFPSFTQCAG